MSGKLADYLFHQEPGIMLYCGDVREVLPLLDGPAMCCVTTPPYWGLRDYGVGGQIGLERTYGEYVAQLVTVLAETRRVHHDSSTGWMNLGDCYQNREHGGYQPSRVKSRDSLQKANRPSYF